MNITEETMPQHGDNVTNIYTYIILFKLAQYLVCHMSGEHHKVMCASLRAFTYTLLNQADPSSLHFRGSPCPWHLLIMLSIILYRQQVPAIIRQEVYM